MSVRRHGFRQYTVKHIQAVTREIFLQSICLIQFHLIGQRKGFFQKEIAFGNQQYFLLFCRRQSRKTAVICHQGIFWRNPRFQRFCFPRNATEYHVRIRSGCHCDSFGVKGRTIRIKGNGFLLVAFAIVMEPCHDIQSIFLGCMRKECHRCILPISGIDLFCCG